MKKLFKVLLTIGIGSTLIASSVFAIKSPKVLGGSTSPELWKLQSSSLKPLKDAWGIVTGSVTTTESYITSITPGNCVQVGADGKLIGAGASCSTTSTAPEVDPFWTAASTTVGYLAKENIWTGAINYFDGIYANLVSSTQAIFGSTTSTNAYVSNLTVFEGLFGNLTAMTAVFGNTTTTDGFFGNITAMTGAIGDLFAGTLLSTNATTSHIYSSTIGLNGIYINNWSDITSTYGWSTSSEQYFWNTTSTWHAFDSNWARNYNATTTLNGFTNNQNDWNTAYSWGNWSTGIWASSTLSVILSNAQTAFSWGNHALAGYLTQAIADLLYQPIGNYLNKDTDPYVETETDPIFMAASTSLPYIAVETDPIWTAASSSYLKVADWESTTTDSLAEGLTNLYYSDTRVGTYINSSTTIQDYFSKAYTAIQTESDPIWSLASTSVAYLANDNTFTGENTFTATTTFGLGTETLTVSKVNVGGLYNFVELSGDAELLPTFLIKDGFIIRGTGTADPSILFINENGSTASGISYIETVDYFYFGDSDLYTSDGNSIQWNTAYSWGNHASAGYLTTESDPIWTAASTSYANLSLPNTFTATTTGTCFTYDGVNCLLTDNAYWTDDTTNLSPNETRGVNIPTGTRYWYNNIPLAYASTSLANWFFGSAGNLTATGTNNIGIGNGALQVVDSGGFNIGIGGSSLAVNTFGNQNIGIGFGALMSNTEGTANIGIGHLALKSNTLGSNNFAIGSSALFENTIGVGNLSLGTLSLEKNTIGNFNIGIGQASLRQNISGGNNIGIGYNSLTNLLQSDGNIGIGIEALFSNTVAASNIGIGFQSLYNTNLASPGIPSQNNMGIGTRAGYNNRGFDNTFIGYEADLLVSASTSNNVIAIGSGIKVGASFAMAIGGINNVVSGYGSWSVGGWNNMNAGLYSGLSGGFGNVINGGSNFSHIIGGQDNLIELGTGSSITASQGGYVSGDYSAIFASSNSTSTGDYSTISGGSDNVSTGLYTSIFGSSQSVAHGTSSTVLGGRFATVDGELATIIGGEYNYASGWDATIIASTNCTTTGHGAFAMNSEWSEANGYGSMVIQSSYAKTDGYGSSAYGTVGVNNLAQFSQVFGSIYSNIADTGVFSLMMNSSSSDIYAPRSVIIGGDDNTITNAYSNIYGGTNNTVSGMFSYAMGSYMTVAGDNSFGINLSPYYAPTPATLSQSNTMSIMGGSVGIGTTTPAYNMTIASTTNWLSLSQGTYGINFSFDENGLLGLPMISGLASSTYVLGGDLEGIAVESKLLIVDEEDAENVAFIFASKELSAAAQIIFDFSNEIMLFSGAKIFTWWNYNETAEVFSIDAENEDVFIKSGSSWAGYAMCYTTNGELGHCTSAVNSSGQCTCVSNN